MDEFSADTGVPIDDARALVEQEGVAHLLQQVDFELYRSDQEVTMDVAEETYGFMAALDDIDPVRDFSRVKLYVEEDLDELADGAPDSYFAQLQDHDPDTDRYPIGEDPQVEIVFDEAHPERRSFPTQYSSIDMGMPTMDGYREHAAAVHDEDYDTDSL